MNATPEKIGEVFAPLIKPYRAAKAEANRTGQPVVVQIMGGSLTVHPDADEVAA